MRIFFWVKETRFLGKIVCLEESNEETGFLFLVVGAILLLLQPVIDFHGVGL